jgi:methylmalonyl-CoA/ethylmalonyl-CoA epimerase
VRQQNRSNENSAKTDKLQLYDSTETGLSFFFIVHVLLTSELFFVSSFQSQRKRTMSVGFVVKCFDHIAFGVRSVAVCAPFLGSVLGGSPLEGGDGAAFEGMQYRFPRGEVLEVIAPTEPTSFLHRFLDHRGPRVHHVTFKVNDIVAAAEQTKRAGFEVVGYDASRSGWKEFFIHPKQAQGIVLQMAEHHPELERNWTKDYDFPPFTPVPALTPAVVLGLRLRVRDITRARAIWGQLLGGEEKPESDSPSGPHRLSFHWRGSPMRICVDVDPLAAADGPAAIELGAGSIGLTAGSVLVPQVLGARFEVVSDSIPAAAL